MLYICTINIKEFTKYLFIFDCRDMSPACLITKIEMRKYFMRIL